VIWCVHPFERTVTSWRKTSDGTYVESIYHGGIVHPEFLPGVAIDLEVLFEE
jgi:hypothetical protein